MAIEEAEEAHQCNSGGGRCATLPTRTGVAIEAETDGRAVPNRRDLS